MKNGVVAKRPTLKKTVKVDFKEVSKALVKGGLHLVSARWDDLVDDGADLSSAIGIEAGEPQLAWLLVSRSLFRALTSLIEEMLDFNQDVIQTKSLHGLVADALSNKSLTLNRRFFEFPEKVPVVSELAGEFYKWLIAQGINESSAKAISERLPSYFSISLHQEWMSAPREYSLLKDSLDTPFTQASEQSQAWSLYTAWLVKQIDEPMFNESFGLKKIFVSPRGYYRRRIQKAAGSEGSNAVYSHSRVVVNLQEYLQTWIEHNDPNDAIRLISGGPGSGKSSFSKMLAAQIAMGKQVTVLHIPLHHFEPSNDLLDAVAKFLEVDGFGLLSPLTNPTSGKKVLIIFDGLDELALQGRLAAKTAQDFVREVQKKVERLNQHKGWVQVVITGRELVMQQSETEFRQEGQIVHLLPYFIHEDDLDDYDDPAELLKTDQRQIWWKLYGQATGAGYVELPAALIQPNLDEITAQPLLNYLVALSLRRGQLVFSSNTNLNAIYSDLLKAIYERGWSKHQHASILGIKESDFYRILEEIAIATWHGDGRTTTVRDIKNHCDTSGLISLLDQFESQLQEDTQTKVTQLLTAFYFRQSGHNSAGDSTFEFTHKSFREYLTAKRIFREILNMRRKLLARKVDADEGWDEREALYRWSAICGITEIDEYLLSFIQDEVKLEYLRSPDVVIELQKMFADLFSIILKKGMPIERTVPRLRSIEEQERSRNSANALFVCLNVFARLTKQISKIDFEDEFVFGEWLLRSGSQVNGFKERLPLLALSYLDLSNCWLNSRNLWSANFEGSILAQVNFVASDCRYAKFDNAKLSGARFSFASILGASFKNADLEGASFHRVSAPASQIKSWDDLNEDEWLESTMFYGANLRSVKFDEADFRNQSFSGLDLSDAKFSGSLLTGVSFRDSNLTNANFANSILNEVDFSGSNVDGVVFPDAF